jgi:hypothetical protein
LIGLKEFDLKIHNYYFSFKKKQVFIPTNEKIFHKDATSQQQNNKHSKNSNSFEISPRSKKILIQQV